MKKTFVWFFIAGFLNGILVWIRERLKEDDATERVREPPGGNTGNAAPGVDSRDRGGTPNRPA